MRPRRRRGEGEEMKLTPQERLILSKKCSQIFIIILILIVTLR